MYSFHYFYREGLATFIETITLIPKNTDVLGISRYFFFKFMGPEKNLRVLALQFQA